MGGVGGKARQGLRTGRREEVLVSTLAQFPFSRESRETERFFQIPPPAHALCAEVFFGSISASFLPGLTHPGFLPSLNLGRRFRWPMGLGFFCGGP